jgi:hypothetical protein
MMAQKLMYKLFIVFNPSVKLSIQWQIPNGYFYARCLTFHKSNARLPLT